MDRQDQDESYEPLLAEVLDQKAVPSSKRSTLLTVCPWILGNELCERLCYYGVATNMVVYVTRIMGGDPAFAAILVSVFEGTCYTTPLLGAYLADSKWGRYKTIMVFSIIYLLGIVLLALSTLVPDSDPNADSANPLQYSVLFASLAVISVGTGGIKPNVSAFGADQFNEACPQDRKEKESFFNWFYLAINVGSLIASTVIVYIQDSVSWTIGFAIPGVAMALAILLFWAGSSGYRHVMPTESPMARVVKVVAAAVKNRWTKRGAPDPSTTANRVVATPNSPGPSEVGSFHGGQLYQQAVSSPTMSNGAGSPCHTSTMTRTGSMHQMPLVHSMSYRWLEDAVTEWQTSRGEVVHSGSLAGYTPKQVEEVKLVVRLLPIFFTTVLYWTVYTQMCTLFVQQGNLMSRQFSWHGETLKIPSASMSLFNTLSVIVLVWVYDAWLEPALKKTQRFRMTLLRRQGWGMVVAAVAMAYAGGLEAWRLSTLAGLPPCPSTVSCAPSDPSETTTTIASASLAASFADSSSMGYGAGGFGGLGGAARRLLYAAGAGSSLPDSGAMAAQVASSSSGFGGVGDMTCLCPDQPSPVTIFWQAPSYFLIGLSEVFTSIGQLEFFYDQAPDVMRSCSMALCLLSTAIGSYLAGALTWAVQVFSAAVTGTQWLPRDLNYGRMDLFFYVLAVVMCANLAGFLAVAVNYTYKAVQHKRHVQPQLVNAAGAPEPLLPSGPSGPGGAGGIPVSRFGESQDRGTAAATGRLPPARNVRGVMAPPGVQPTTAPLAIGPRTIGARAGGPAGMRGQAQDADMSDLEVYSRSLAYVPPSPNIPAPFR